MLIIFAVNLLFIGKAAKCSLLVICQLITSFVTTRNMYHLDDCRLTPYIGTPLTNKSTFNMVTSEQLEPADHFVYQLLGLTIRSVVCVMDLSKSDHQ